MKINILELQALYLKNKSNIFLPKLEIFKTSSEICFGYLFDYLENFLEHSDWFFELSNNNPEKTPIAIRICLENFIEINYLLSQVFDSDSNLKRNINAIILKKDLKTYKKFNDFLNAQIIGDKTTNFDDSEIKKIIKIGYANTIKIANEQGIYEILKIKNIEDIEKIPSRSLDDSIRTKFENASLSHLGYWWNNYSFLCEFVHPNSVIKKLIPAESRVELCSIWYKQMLDLLVGTLEKSKLD